METAKGICKGHHMNLYLILSKERIDAARNQLLKNARKTETEIEHKNLLRKEIKDEKIAQTNVEVTSGLIIPIIQENTVRFRIEKDIQEGIDSPHDETEDEIVSYIVGASRRRESTKDGINQLSAQMHLNQEGNNTTIDEKSLLGGTSPELGRFLMVRNLAKKMKASRKPKLLELGSAGGPGESANEECQNVFTRLYRTPTKRYEGI